MMDVLPWIMFIPASLCCLIFHRLFWRSITRERHLEDYIVYLLLSDRIRSKHKQDLEQLIQKTDIENADQLHRYAHKAIENMAEILAKGDPSSAMTSSMFGAHSIILRVKRGEHVN